MEKIAYLNAKWGINHVVLLIKYPSTQVKITPLIFQNTWFLPVKRFAFIFKKLYEYYTDKFLWFLKINIELYSVKNVEKHIGKTQAKSSF